MTSNLKSLFFGRETVITYGIIAVAEFLSFCGFLFPEFNTAGFLLFTLAAFALSLRKLEYGLGFIFAELAIGSKGHLFHMDVFGFTVSIRLAIFLVLIIAWGVALARERRIELFRLSYWKWYAAFIAVLVLGTLQGVLRGNNTGFVFFDVNGYLFFGLLPVLLQGIRSRESLFRLFRVISGGILASATEVIILLFVFSHNFIALMPVVYRWIRVTGVGEITRIDGNFHRIFFQSHIYDLLFLFLLLIVLFVNGERPRLRQYFSLARDPETRPVFLLFLSTSMIILLSWSRSFWLAAVVTGIGMYAWLWSRKKYRFRDLARLSFALFLSAIMTIVFLGIVLNIPIDGQGWGGTSLFGLAKSRATNIDEEPAAASRFLLLPKLLERAREHPLIGSGFGTTVTYTTQDPRFLETHPDGAYTTFAFEWGYLDMMTEVGLFGLLIFAMLLVNVFRDGMRLIPLLLNEREKKCVLGLLFGLIALLVVHVTTPYLNHPLGISFIVLSIAAFSVLKTPSHEPAE